MKIYIGADHRGFDYKEHIKAYLTDKGFEVIDCGNSHYDEQDDYPDFSVAVGNSVASHEAMPLPGSTTTEALGIVICGSGGGVTIAANKVHGVRCAQGVNVADVAHNRQHNNINILAIGSDFVTIDVAKSMVDAFLTTAYTPEERFVRRLKKIIAVEG